MTAKTEDVSPQVMRPGSCLWCGHQQHAKACVAKIRTGVGQTPPCPCVRHESGLS